VPEDELAVARPSVIFTVLQQQLEFAKFEEILMHKRLEVLNRAHACICIYTYMTETE
jgi:hypothetical protein